MKTPSLLEVAKMHCHFVKYQEGLLWYLARLDGDQAGSEADLAAGHFLFPVPVEDAGEGAFLPCMKGINLLRWARKHMEMLEEAHHD